MLNFQGQGMLIEDHLWYYIQNKRQIPLRQNEFYRLGKIIFRVAMIKQDQTKLYIKKTDKEQKQNILFDNIQIDGIQQVQKIQTDSSKQCRICFGKEEINDPFLALCNCASKNPYHLSCMKQWLASKSEIRNSDQVVQYNFKKINCELCQEQFPMIVKYKNKNLVLFQVQFDLNRPKLILEIFDKTFEQIKGVVCLYLDSQQKKFSVGRSEKCDVKFEDFSVSRKHACLTVKNNSILLSDLGSKFGTLQLLQKPLYPKLFEQIHLQIDKFYLVIHPFIRKKNIFQKNRKMNTQVNPFSDFNDIDFEAEYSFVQESKLSREKLEIFDELENQSQNLSVEEDNYSQRRSNSFIEDQRVMQINQNTINSTQQNFFSNPKSKNINQNQKLEQMSEQKKLFLQKLEKVQNKFRNEKLRQNQIKEKIYLQKRQSSRVYQFSQLNYSKYF